MSSSNPPEMINRNRVGSGRSRIVDCVPDLVQAERVFVGSTSCLEAIGQAWTAGMPNERYMSSGRSWNAGCEVSGLIARKSRRSRVSREWVRYSAASATLTASARSRFRAEYLS
jgi:hypothetical protein